MSYDVARLDGFSTRAMTALARGGTYLRLLHTGGDMRAMNDDAIILESTDLVVRIARLGAEMQSIQDTRGRDYLWDGDPAVWKGRAPILFPMVGRAAQDRIVIDGQVYPMRQHGFARTSHFTVADAARDRCVMTLTDDATTLACYPFPFRLDIAYALAGRELSIAATVRNTGDRAMPMSFGFHPAFRWPLPGAESRENHEIVFDAPEPEPIRRLSDGLVMAHPIPSPVVDRTLALFDALFAHDALVFDRPVSRGVTYRGPTDAAVRVTFADIPYLGVWTKPGAGYVCIEPWHGLASPQGFDGEFAQRPGVISIAAGARHTFAITVAFPVDANAAPATR